MRVLRVRCGSAHVSPIVRNQRAPCEYSEYAKAPARAEGSSVARCRHGPDHHREPAHPPFTGTAEYPCRTLSRRTFHPPVPQSTPAVP